MPNKLIDLKCDGCQLFYCWFSSVYDIRGEHTYVERHWFKEIRSNFNFLNF